MAKATTLKATIKAALDNRTATLHDGGKAVLHNGVLYTVRADGYRRMPAQKENRRRLGIVLPPPAPPVAQKTTGTRVIIGPPPGRGRRAWFADFSRMVERMRERGDIPAPVKV